MNAMMNVVLLFGALLSAPAPTPKAPSHSVDEKAIKADHLRLLAAFKARNADAIKSLFTKGFTQNANGTIYDRDGAVAQMTQGSASAKVDWTIGGIEVRGDKASYTSNFKFETTSGAKGKTHKISGAGVQKIQLVKENGKWLYSHLEVTSSKIIMDGKLFNPQAPSKE